METNQKVANFFKISTAIVGVLLFSSKAVFVKMVYQYNIDPVSVIVLRMMFALPLILTIWFVYEKKSGFKKPSGKEIMQVIVLSVVGYYISAVFDFFGLVYISASLERIILFVYPTIVLLLSGIYLKKPVKSNQIIAVVICYVGLFIIFSNRLSISLNLQFWTGTALVFVSACTYAVFLTGSGELIPRVGTVRFTSIAMIVTTISILSHYKITGNGDLFNYPTAVYIDCLLMSVFATVIPAYLISVSVKQLGASTVAVIGSIGPVATLLMAYLFLDEIISLRMLLGMSVVIGGVVSISFKTNIKKQLVSFIKYKILQFKKSG